MEKRELANKLEKIFIKENEQKFLTVVVENIAKKNYAFYIYLSKKHLEANDIIIHKLMKIILLF